MGWGCVGVALGVGWGCVGVALGVGWGCVGVALGLRWVALGLRWVFSLPFSLPFLYQHVRIKNARKNPGKNKVSPISVLFSVL